MLISNNQTSGAPATPQNALPDQAGVASNWQITVPVASNDTSPEQEDSNLAVSGQANSALAPASPNSTASKTLDIPKSAMNSLAEEYNPQAPFAGLSKTEQEAEVEDEQEQDERPFIIFENPDDKKWNLAKTIFNINDCKGFSFEAISECEDYAKLWTHL